MDLISSLAGKLGIDSGQAQAVAGSVLGGVSGALGEEFGGEARDKLEEAVPELGGWQEKAASLLEAEPKASGGLFGGGGLGGVLGAAAGALGGQGARDIAAVTQVLGKLGVDGGKAALVAPLVLDFLKKRVDESLLSKILSVAPMLSGAGEGGIGGLVGGLLK